MIDLTADTPERDALFEDLGRVPSPGTHYRISLPWRSSWSRRSSTTC